VFLPDDAVAALAALRRTVRDVRFEVRKACEQERWRLKVLWLARDPETGVEERRELGLLWSEDHTGILDLRDRLVRGEDGGAPAG
jgi:hypothetical protein